MLKCNNCGGVFAESNTNQSGFQCPVWKCYGTLGEVQGMVKCAACGNVYGSPPLRPGGTCPGPLGGSGPVKMGYQLCGGTLYTYMNPVVPLRSR